MNLIEFKQKIESNKYTLPKICYRPLNRVVVFNGKFDYPIKLTSSNIEWKMYQRVLEYVLNKKKV